MKSIPRSARIAAVLLAASAAVAAAGYPCHQTRTYFGRPGVGPYGPPEGYAGHGGHGNPWTGTFFGLRCCKTPHDCYQDYIRRASVAEARYQAMMNRSCAKPCWSNLSGGLCAGPCACPPGPECAGGCGKSGGCGPAGCRGGGCGLLGGCCAGKHGGGMSYGAPPGAMPLPDMNREDAVRYAEGMMYYPPYQLLRSPRDFFMFDVKYGIGQ